MLETTSNVTSLERYLKRLTSYVLEMRTRQLLLIAIVLIPSLILLIVQAFQNQQRAEERLNLQARMMALQIGMYAKDLLPDPEVFLSQLATLPELSSGDTSCSTFLQTALRADYFFDNLFLAKPDGDVFCTGVPLKKPLNISNRTYFARAMATKKFTIGDFQVTRDRQVPVIIFALPVLDHAGNVVAILGAAAKLNWFQIAFDRAMKDTIGHLEKPCESGKM